jgi:hypothetical protein
MAPIQRLICVEWPDNQQDLQALELESLERRSVPEKL